MTFSFTEKKRIRKDFGKQKPALDVPDLLTLQVESYEKFLQKDVDAGKRKNIGLQAAFNNLFPIESFSKNARLEFISYRLEEPEFNVRECQLRGLSYAAPLRVKTKLITYDKVSDKETVKEVKNLKQTGDTTDVYFGEVPLMTEHGTFVINGTDRVIVSQLHRSPGVFFAQSKHTNGTPLYSARIIPFRGSWIEFATDVNNVMYAYIDRKKKFPITTLLRAIGYGSDKDILDIFQLSEEVEATKTKLKKALGKKLAARVLKTWVEDFVDEDTGEVISIDRNELILDRDHILVEEDIETIISAEAPFVTVHREDINIGEFTIIYNTLKKDVSNLSLIHI